MLYRFSLLISSVILLATLTACSSNNKTKNTNTSQSKATKVVKKATAPVVYEKRSPKRRTVKRPRIQRSSFANNLSSAALGRLRSNVRYDGSYVKIAYPWGDVPKNIGVCTDVVIRSYRKLGIDLQQQVHQDMTRSFNTYPNLRKWGLSRPDANIDHRRVYNLRQFFTRKGAALPVTRNPRDYRPGDLVTWMVGPGLPHIGVVVNKRSKANPNRYMIVHNIARGPEIEDVLFRFPISGHYRYTPRHIGNVPNIRNIASMQRNRSGANNLTHSELVEAARILGKTPIYRAKPTPSSKKKSPVQLANLSGLELEKLLRK